MALDLPCLRFGVFSVKYYSTFQFMFFIILLLSRLPLIRMDANSGLTNKESKKIVWKIADMSKEQLKLLREFIEIVEKLNILKSGENQSECFYLETVVRDVTFEENSSPKVGIHFYFQDPGIISDRSSKLSQDNNIYSDHFHNANTDLMIGACNLSNPLPDKRGLDRLSRKQDDKNQNISKDSTSNINVTDSTGAKQMGDGKASQNDRNRGLSRTQVVVIATCSAVIGTFFIIAGAMRIHSCMKRYRANREAALVIARRSSAFGFGSGNLRRDSASSKASRQQSHPTSKNGSDLQIDRNGRSQPSISHTSPQHSSDHNPLLPVHLVGQISDGNSSHGSLAFIDEESHNRSKQNDNTSGSEFGSEDDPLLRKSPDSGSSIDIGLETDDKVNVKNKYMTVSSETLKGSKCSSMEKLRETPERKDVFEPGGELGVKYGSKNQMPLQTDIKDTNKDSINETEKSETFKDSIHSPKKDSKDQQDKRRSNLGKMSEKLSSSDENIPSKAETYSHKQFSVDYFDVDENGVEIQNPIFELEEETEQCARLSENQAITTGLTQSDSSISDNPSYSYGNQTEYDFTGGYGNFGYCCPFVSNADNNMKCLDSSFTHNSLRNAEFLSAELLRRENGDIQIESSDESPQCGNSSSSMHEPDKLKYPRMYSTESYFGNSPNKPSQFERSFSETPENVDESGTKSTDSTSSTQKLHIIPLHEYHRNSLKDTFDEDV